MMLMNDGAFATHVIAAEHSYEEIPANLAF